MNELSELNIVGQKPSGWRPVAIRDIHGEKIWPKHLENFIGHLHDDVSIHSIGAALAHTMFVEVGFVPSNEMPDHDPAIIMEMEYKDFMLKFGSQEPCTGFRNNIFAARFKAIVGNDDLDHPELVRGEYSQDEVHTHFLKRGRMDNPPIAVNETDANCLTTIDESDTSVTLSAQDRAVRFRYSAEIKVIFIVKNEWVEILVNGKTDTANHLKTYELNILEFCESLNCGPIMPAERWLKEIKLNGSKLSSTFKQDFLLGIFDGMNGIRREFLGIQSLPPEIMIKILKMCPTKTVTRMARTSHYFRSVTEDEGLWKHCINRDYPISEHTEIQKSLNNLDMTMKDRYRRLFDDEMRSQRKHQPINLWGFLDFLQRR